MPMGRSQGQLGSQEGLSRVARVELRELLPVGAAPAGVASDLEGGALGSSARSGGAQWRPKSGAATGPSSPDQGAEGVPHSLRKLRAARPPVSLSQLRDRSMGWAAATCLLLLVGWLALWTYPGSGVQPLAVDTGLHGTSSSGMWAAAAGANATEAAGAGQRERKLEQNEVKRRGPMLVEFTAPGLFLPIGEALSLGLADQPEEAALLAASGAGASWDALKRLEGGEEDEERPTLEEVLERYEQAHAGQLIRGAGDRVSSTVNSTGANSRTQLAQQVETALQATEEAVRAAAEAEGQAEAEQGEGEGGSVPGRRLLQAQAAAAGGNARAPSNATRTGGGAAGGGVRMLVGITSACCTELAARRRAAIRESWLTLTLEHHPHVDVRFVLGQPPSAAALVQWLPALEEEARAHGDLIVVRGEDLYRNLPNKTLRLLRYMLAHPAGYTHLLKTDDDCYVRTHKVLAALADDPDSPAGSSAARAAAVGRAPPTPAQQQLATWARGLGKPLHTDGLMVYDARGLVRGAGAAADQRYLDDSEGNAISVSQLATQTQGGGNVGDGGSATAGKGMRRALQGAAAAEKPPRMTGVYLGCVENKGGFFPIRDPKSKWYMPYDQLPDSAVPFGVKYGAGWGYVLSRDLIAHAVGKANAYLRSPQQAPAWFSPLHWEDVMIGLLLDDVVDGPQDHPGFRAAWRACPADTAVKHLDVDAPLLMRGLCEQERSGLWESKPVACSSGPFLPGDYSGWKKWRDALPSVDRI